MLSIFDKKEKKLSQEKLAEKLGVTRQTLSNWEGELTAPDLIQSQKIAGFFEASLDELVGNEYSSIFSRQLSATQHLVKRQTKDMRNILRLLYVIVLIFLFSVGIYFFQKKDFTKEGQMEFVCTKEDVDYRISVTKEEERYLVDIYASTLEKETYPAGNSIGSAVESLETVKRVFLAGGASCK